MKDIMNAKEELKKLREKVQARGQISFQIDKKYSLYRNRYILRTGEIPSMECMSKPYSDTAYLYVQQPEAIPEESSESYENSSAGEGEEKERLTECAEPTERVDSIDPMGIPVESEFVESVESIESVESVESVESTESIESTDSIESIESTEQMEAEVPMTDIGERTVEVEPPAEEAPSAGDTPSEPVESNPNEEPAFDQDRSDNYGDDDYYGDEYDEYYRDEYDDHYGDDEYYDSYSDENYYGDMENSSPEPEPVQPIESIEEDDDDLEIEADEKMEFTMDFKPRHTALASKLDVYVCADIPSSIHRNHH